MGQLPDIAIRTATPADAGALCDIYAPYVRETAVTFEYEVPSEHEFAGRVERTVACYPYLVAVLAEQVVGYAHAGTFKTREAYDRSCEMTIYLDRDVRGQGIGRALYIRLEAELAAMGITNLYACIAATDTPDETLDDASIRFHEALGYRLCGTFRSCGYKFDRWYDMVWMEKMVGSHTVPAAAFTPWPRIARP